MISFRDKQLPQNKEIRVVLNKIKGISWFHSYFLTLKLGFSYPFSINNLNNYYYSIIFNILNKWILTNIKLDELIKNNILLLIENDTYKGIRHKHCLPVHGQRTRSNANTQRAKKVIKVIKK